MSASVRDRLAVRVPLEVIAATEAAWRMSEDDYIELEQLSTNISHTISSDSYYGTTEADLLYALTADELN